MSEVEKLKKENKALKMACFQYQKRIDDLLYIEKSVHRKIDSLKTRLDDRLNKTSSGQYFVFDFDEYSKKFHSPLIVDASCWEEALIPEDESYEKGFCMEIWHRNDFKEI